MSSELRIKFTILIIYIFLINHCCSQTLDTSPKCQMPEYGWILPTSDSTLMSIGKSGDIELITANSNNNEFLYYKIMNSSSDGWIVQYMHGFIALMTDNETLTLRVDSSGKLTSVRNMDFDKCIMDIMDVDTLGKAVYKFHCDYLSDSDCFEQVYANGKIKYRTDYMPASMAERKGISIANMYRPYNAVVTKSGYYDENGEFHLRPE